MKIGSARIDERGKLSGGASGDQKQTKAPDMEGEVSQQAFYVHSKGWRVFTPKTEDLGKRIAQNMIDACNNKNIGYDQGNRTAILKAGIHATTKTECDCSSLVRACIKEATGKDPGNFTTQTEAAVLRKTGLFIESEYKTGDVLKLGSILVTKVKGHTVIVTEADKPKAKTEYYPKYTGKSTSLVDALKSVGANSSKSSRAQIAGANGIKAYSGTAEQNQKLLALLKAGKLKK